MAKPEARITIHLEPSEETLQMSKRMLEMWLNKDPHRYIQIEEQYTDDSRKVRLNLVEGDPFVVREPDE